MTDSDAADWPADARRDRLIGNWHIYQRTGGHRTSTDDLITAWFAVHRQPDPPPQYLDLGCGIGSVLLMVSHKLRPAHAHGVEAQAQSVAMARRSIAELPENNCTFDVDLADFRELSLARRYSLITGSPPYFPTNAGVLPKNAQKRACRFETRGGVEAYCDCAKRALSDDGRFYLVFQTIWEQRVLNAGARAKLHCSARADFFARADKDTPFLSVFEFSQVPAVTPYRFTCAVRDRFGKITSEYAAIRRELGVDANAM